MGLLSLSITPSRLAHFPGQRKQRKETTFLNRPDEEKEPKAEVKEQIERHEPWIVAMGDHPENWGVDHKLLNVAKHLGLCRDKTRQPFLGRCLAIGTWNIQLTIGHLGILLSVKMAMKKCFHVWSRCAPAAGAFTITHTAVRIRSAQPYPQVDLRMAWNIEIIGICNDNNNRGKQRMSLIVKRNY